MPGRDDRDLNEGAENGELGPGDRAILEAMEKDSGPDPEDRVEGSLSDDEDVTMDVGAVPASERTSTPDLDGETVDGLSDLEEAVRQQAEDRALGDDEDFKA